VVLGVVVATVAAVGWLYLLRQSGLLDWSPRIRGALPLQQLAGDADQPLARMLIAWVPLGVVAGVLAARARLGLGGTAMVTALTSWALLVIAGAGSDAAAISESIPSHLPAQLTRAGTWVAVALMTGGSVLGWRLARPRKIRPT
jgi:hypothetical protein